VAKRSQPRGTVVIHPAGWDTQNLYTIGFQNQFLSQPPGNNYCQVSIQNADTKGRSMVVWAVAAGPDGGGGFMLTYGGRPAGTAQSQAQAINPQNPPISVFSYFQQQNVALGANSPFLTTQINAVFPTAGFDGFMVSSEFPLMIVPTTFSALFSSQTSIAAVSLGLWFTME
jgi:hypothetical protein